MKTLQITDEMVDAAKRLLPILQLRHLHEGSERFGLHDAMNLATVEAIVAQSAEPDHESRLPSQPRADVSGTHGSITTGGGTRSCEPAQHADQPPKLARLEAFLHGNSEWFTAEEKELLRLTRLDFADELAAARQADQKRIVELEAQLSEAKARAGKRVRLTEEERLAIAHGFTAGDFGINGAVSRAADAQYAKDGGT
jgi:hypothetical protein